ncbi:hypothetical protein BU23DRAFT_549676 [Bimuria novae-zelandiae CBS 107.79]|uniref:F-box domain-containing protein n=1 Tax=Bimuria novae-zelandiae CBS 107.79 TaxID=1447943 RepID=A0A6A5VQY5_9PLEO|nr:hypothetical protein BU23DRAFT_549676 [Bimuria novae-zelandiae CBS 107.79]
MHLGAIRNKILDRIPFVPEYFLRRNGTFTRRKRLDELPEDVLISILSYCRIDDIFALRLTCSSLRDVFSNYQAHIVPSVARCTFPKSSLLLKLPTGTVGHTFTWLKELIPRHLAAILVDRYKLVFDLQPFGYRHGIPAEEPYGDALRSEVASGWKVLRRLSNISKEVYSMEVKQVFKLSGKSANWTRVNRDAVAQMREELVMKRRLSYINTLSSEEAGHYVVMFTLLSAVFRARTYDETGPKDGPIWLFDSGYGIDASRFVRKGESWMTWFILHQGPQLFRDQWWSFSAEAPGTKNYVRDRALEAFFAPLRPKDYAVHTRKKFIDPQQRVHDMQQNFARQVQSELSTKSANNSSHMHMIYFHAYRLEELTGGRPAVEETMTAVPFTVDFFIHEG